MNTLYVVNKSNKLWYFCCRAHFSSMLWNTVVIEQAVISWKEVSLFPNQWGWIESCLSAGVALTAWVMFLLQSAVMVLFTRRFPPSARGELCAATPYLCPVLLETGEGLRWDGQSSNLCHLSVSVTLSLHRQYWFLKMNCEKIIAVVETVSRQMSVFFTVLSHVLPAEGSY